MSEKIMTAETRDMTCLGGTFAAINGLELASHALSEMFRAMDEPTEKYPEGVSCGHLFWAIPANFVLNLVTFAMAPVVALVNLLAVAVLALFCCCSYEAQKGFIVFLLMSAHALTDVPLTAIIRIVNPMFRGMCSVVRSS
jgi:hypothetical protein